MLALLVMEDGLCPEVSHLSLCLHVLTNDLTGLDGHASHANN